ncbi:MAG: GxxExxY protein [Planctomycetota bacterium]
MKDPIFELCDRVREISFALHCYLKHGYLEKVYENGLTHRLRKQNIQVEQQVPLDVIDEDCTPIGQYIADLVVEQKLLIELKAVSTLAPEHTAQLLGYLKATNLEHGLLINFGAPKLQIKKYALSPT